MLAAHLLEPDRPLLVAHAAGEHTERRTGRVWVPPVPVAAVNSLRDVKSCSFFFFITKVNKRMRTRRRRRGRGDSQQQHQQYLCALERMDY